eukprot:gene9264-10975_t
MPSTAINGDQRRPIGSFHTKARVKRIPLPASSNPMPSEVLRLNKSHKRKLREKLGRNFGSDIQLGDIYLPPPDLPTGESTDDRQKLSLLAHGRPSTGDASPDAMNRKGEEEKKNRKLLFESRLRMYLGLMSFMLTFMHPSVSTFMFQLFNCDKIFFDQDEAQWWLAIDRRLECFTAEWSGYASMATLVICVYVLGLPLGIFVSTSYFDRYKQVCTTEDGTGPMMFVSKGSLQIRTEGYFVHDTK